MLEHEAVGVVTLSQFYDVIVEPCGDIVVTGYIVGDAAWDDMPAFADASPLGDWDVVVARLGADGGSLWERRIGSSAKDAGGALTSDTAGRVYVGGRYDSDVMTEAWPTSGACGEPEGANKNAFLLQYSQ